MTDRGNVGKPLRIGISYLTRAPYLLHQANRMCSAALRSKTPLAVATGDDFTPSLIGNGDADSGHPVRAVFQRPELEVAEPAKTFSTAMEPRHGGTRKCGRRTPLDHANRWDL